MRLDSTFERVDFSYTNSTGTKTSVKTLEEIEYPNYYYKRGASDDLEDNEPEGLKELTHPTSQNEIKTEELKTQIPTEGHITISENQRGISFDKLFGLHLSGAKMITLTDPYIRVFHQIRNLIEFVETIVKVKQKEDNVVLHLITQPDDMRGDQQQNYLTQVQQSAEPHGINFTWEFDTEGTTHARHIITDDGWKVTLDRGLDVFQRFEMNDAFNLNNRLQETRACKAFEITYLKI